MTTNPLEFDAAEPTRDEVDHIVAAWRRERPDLDVSPLHILSRISRVARRLDQARKAAYTRHGLDSWGFEVLTALRRAGEPYQRSPGQLVTETMVTSGTMTNRVDRLVDSGDVLRLPDPNDRRGVLVQLTDQGRDRVDAALADLLAHEQVLLRALDEHQSAALTTALRALVTQLDTPTSETP